MAEPAKPPKPVPVFTVDLGKNGGRFAPTSPLEVAAWLRKEQNAWSWIMSRSHGNHDYAIRDAYSQLASALNQADEAARLTDSSADRALALVTALSERVIDIYQRRNFPHTSTTAFKRIEAFRAEFGDTAGSFFAAVVVPPPQGYHLQPTDLASWRGLFEGLLDRYPDTKNFVGKIKAEEAAFEEIRGKLESLLAEKQTVLDELHRATDSLHEAHSAALTDRQKAFVASQDERKKDFDEQMSDHRERMEALQKTFREEMGLRAPAEYWANKRWWHLGIAFVTGAVTFVALACAVRWLTAEIQAILAATPPNTQPETWRFATLAVVSLFTIWGIRLVVRLFLSHIHLATDAAERVVMVKTYLSLAEGDRLSGAEDRQLILSALFRPAADGVVKDEGVPVSALEFLSRNPKS